MKDEKKKKKSDPHGPFAALGALKKKLEEEAKGPKQPERPRAANPPPKPSTPRTASAPEEDTLALHRWMSGVTPLEGKHQRVARSAGGDSGQGGRGRERLAEATRTLERENDDVRAHLRSLVEGGSRFEVSDDGHHVEGRRTDLPIDWLRKLRRGQIAIDARLDLHGLRADEAKQTLELFLREKRTRGERCVLVIHGKGERTRGAGILRGEMAAWLSQGEAAESVSAFATALEQEGGEGAVYVLLRR